MMYTVDEIGEDFVVVNGERLEVDPPFETLPDKQDYENWLNEVWRKSDGSPVFTLNLTARGIPLGEGTRGAFNFFELGREWIVKGFTDLTTPEMQRVWERTDA